MMMGLFLGVIIAVTAPTQYPQDMMASILDTMRRTAEQIRDIQGYDITWMRDPAHKEEVSKTHVELQTLRASVNDHIEYIEALTPAGNGAKEIIKRVSNGSILSQLRRQEGQINSLHKKFAII